MKSDVTAALAQRVAQLSPAQRDALLARIPSAQGTTPSPDVIRPRASSETPPLSYAQQRLWFLHQLEPLSPAYNMASAWRLSGPLAVEALARAFQEIGHRHESLRTTFPEKEGCPFQAISDRVGFELIIHDLSERPE